MRLALGIDENLWEFAATNNAETYASLNARDWRMELIDLMEGTANVEVLWDLTGVHVADGLQRATSGATSADGTPVMTMTDWELWQFCQRPSWRARALFYLDGSPQPDPFADLDLCPDE